MAFELKRRRALGEPPRPTCAIRVLAMLFFFPSHPHPELPSRPGMAQLGGHAQFIESRTTQIAHGDTPKEIGEILGRYNDGIAIRHVTWAEGTSTSARSPRPSRVPVLNMQCDELYDPFENPVRPDDHTSEKKGSLRGPLLDHQAGPTPRATRSRSACRRTWSSRRTRFGMNSSSSSIRPSSS